MLQQASKSWWKFCQAVSTNCWSRELLVCTYQLIPMPNIQPKQSHNTFALHRNWIVHFPSCNPIHEYSSAASALWGELGWEFGEKVATAANQNPGKVNLWPCVYKSAKSWQHLGSLGGRDFRKKMISRAPTELPLIKVVMTQWKVQCHMYFWTSNLIFYI